MGCSHNWVTLRMCREHGNLMREDFEKLAHGLLSLAAPRYCTCHSRISFEIEGFWLRCPQEPQESSVGLLLLFFYSYYFDSYY